MNIVKFKAFHTVVKLKNTSKAGEQLHYPDLRKIYLAAQLQNGSTARDPTNL